jgi:hypothetical protein
MNYYCKYKATCYELPGRIKMETTFTANCKLFLPNYPRITAFCKLLHGAKLADRPIQAIVAASPYLVSFFALELFMQRFATCSVRPVLQLTSPAMSSAVSC